MNVHKPLNASSKPPLNNHLNKIINASTPTPAPNQHAHSANKQPATLSWQWYALAAVVLVAATVIAYYPSLTYDFQFDDIYNIRKFFHLRFQPIKQFAFGGGRWISYALNTIHYKMGQYDPFVYRRSNMIFHITTGILMFFVTLLGISGLRNYRYSQKALPIAFFTALLFLLHPVQTQTVSYIIQGQLEGLACLCTMAILLCYIFYSRAQSIIAKTVFLVFIAILGILSCGTKEITILVPIMLVLFDWFFISQGSFEKLTQKALFFIGYTALIAFQFVRYLDLPFLKNSLLGKAALVNNIGNVITDSPQQAISSYYYCISQFKVVTHYIAMFLWPFNISVDYDWKMVSSFFSAECILPLLFLLTLLGAAIYLLTKNKINLVSFCSLWFFIGLAPRSTIVPSTELIADYKTYFSSFGMCLLLALGLVYGYQWVMKKVKLRKAVFSSYIASGLLIGLLGYGTYDRNKVWKSGEAFWMNIIENSPGKARAYNNYGVAIAEQKRYEEAIPFFRKAIKLDRMYPDPWSNGSVCYSCIGKLDIAIDLLRKAISINPLYPEFYNNLSSYLLQKGEFPEVKRLAQEAIRLRPYYGKAYFNWGQALYQEGNKVEAHEKIKHACLNADYDVADSFRSYAEISVELQKYEDALVGFTKLYNLNQNDNDALFNVGNAYYYLEKYAESKQVFTTLIERNPTEYRSWINLAEVHLKQNNPQMALACYEKAQPIAQAYPNLPARIAECRQLVSSTRIG